MGAFVAWLWFFPLFGILQAALTDDHGKMTVFNLTFLFATILGYLIFLLIRNYPVLNTLIALSAPATALATWLTALSAWGLPEDVVYFWGFHSIGVFVLIPAIMGCAGAFYFAFWGTTIFYIPTDKRGRYMAAMVATATFFYVCIVLVYTAFPLPALILAGLILFIPSYFLKTVNSFVESSEKRKASQVYLPSDEGLQQNLNPLRAFWLPFGLTILCFYILSWATHDIIFSAIKAESTLFPILGQIFYALVFLFTAIFLDREKEIEKTAILGLIVLGCTFLLLPVATSFEVVLPLYFLLEGSYGLIDLFMWVSLAYFCQLLGGNPKQYYAQGLMLNVLFIVAGIILMPLLNVNIEGRDYFLLSLAAGLILFLGVLPAFSLRKIRLASQGRTVLSDMISEEIGKLKNGKGFQVDVLTQKEKEVFYLMLAGLNNTEITEKMDISKNTLKTHVRHIYSKTGVKNRSELIFKYASFSKKD